MDVDDSDLSLAKRNFLLFNAAESDVKFVFTVDPELKIFIYAHKRILSIGSFVFDQMFNGLMASFVSSNDCETVEIADISFECFKNLLMFIYIGAIELNLEIVAEVMYAAHKYQVCKLESMCSDFLYKSMDTSNVFEIHETTLMFNNNITSLCLQWIDDLFDELIKTDGFMNLKKSTLMDLMRRDTLNIGELNLFKAVYKWAEQQCCEASIEPSDDNLRTYADNFKHIRFPTMRFQEFAECTRYGLNILTSDEKIDVWDALSRVKRSVYFNSAKRISPATSYKSFTFWYSPQPFIENATYSFEFKVSRTVHLIAITVIRSCILTIHEKESDDIYFFQSKQCAANVNETNTLLYRFVPNVQYRLEARDAFKCGRHRFLGPFGGRYEGEAIDPTNFRSYSEMIRYYNFVTQIDLWNSEQHDPFLFATPQRSLIRSLTYKTRK